jgi:hypothetical protein
MKQDMGLILKLYCYIMSETTTFRKQFWLLIRGEEEKDILI